MVSDNHLLADIGVVANFAIAADDRRAFDHGAILDHCSVANKNLLTDPGDSFAAILQGGLEIGLDVWPDLLQRFPRQFAPIEKRAMLGLRKIKQIRRLEHGGEGRRKRPKVESRGNSNEAA